MCGRFFLSSKTKARLEEYYGIANLIEKSIENGSELNVKVSGEIFPSDVVPVIALTKDKRVSAFLMQWGYKPFKEGGRLLINARSETAEEKITFREGMNAHRCLIPASWYFEWKKQNGEKIKHAIMPEGDEEFFMAGIYRFEKDKKLPVFTILTKEASADIFGIHDRMPVIVPKSEWVYWLDKGYSAKEIEGIKAVPMTFNTEI